MRSAAPTAVAFVSGLTLLCGCSVLLPPPATGPQTVEQACVALYNFEVRAVLRKVNSDMAETADPTALAESIDSFTAVFGTYVPELRNEPVKAQAEKVLKAWRDAGTLLKSSKRTKAWRKSVRKVGTRMETEGGNLETLCFGKETLS